MPRAGGAFAFMDVFELTRALVALETPSGSEGPAIGLLEGLLRGAGYRVVRQPVSAGRDNLYAYAGRPPPRERRFMLGVIRVVMRLT